MSETVIIAISGVGGAVIGKVIDSIFTKKKSDSEVIKTTAEASTLTSKEKREQEKFCMEQLQEIQDLYITMKSDRDEISKAFDEYKRIAREKEEKIEVKLKAAEEREYEYQRKITALELRLSVYYNQ